MDELSVERFLCSTELKMETADGGCAVRTYVPVLDKNGNGNFG